MGMDKDDNYYIKIGNDRLCFKILHILEFNSKRKRMSVILRDSEGTVRILTKGADSIIAKRLRSDQTEELKKAFDSLESFGTEGLRTLMLAERIIPDEEYNKWANEYKIACTSMKNRELLMEEQQDRIEVGLEIVGCTAIEDKLQDEVPETIDLLAKAKVKLWVLTGDKGKTT